MLSIYCLVQSYSLQRMFWVGHKHHHHHPQFATTKVTRFPLYKVQNVYRNHHHQLPLICICFNSFPLTKSPLKQYLFSLAVFFWTNVMAWDIYKTFGQRTILSHIRPTGEDKMMGVKVTIIMIFCGCISTTIDSNPLSVFITIMIQIYNDTNELEL